MSDPELIRSTILVVDDEKNLRSMLEHVLSFHGYDVLGADSAEAALELVREHHPDLVVTDLKMPGRGGLDLIQEIRAEAANEKIMIIAITGNITTTMTRAGEIGANTTLLKPFSPAEFIAEVRKLLGQKQA